MFRYYRSARLTEISTSILFAVGNQTVNYLSLDIEGAEIQVAIAVAQQDLIVKYGLKRSGREKKISIDFDCSGEKKEFDTHIVHHVPFF